MITILAQIESARKRLAVPNELPWVRSVNGKKQWKTNGPFPWKFFDRESGSTSFSTTLFGMEPKLFKLYRQWGDDMIGFEVKKDGVHVSTGFPSANHEIAHWVEMKDENRWLLPNWGIPTKSFIRPDRFTKGTREGEIAALSREMRVMAIQAHMESFLVEKDPGQMRERMTRWADEAFLKDFQLPFGKLKERQDIRNWAGQIWQTTFDIWNLDRIEFEFKNRIQMVKNFMETKEKLK